MLLSAKTKLIVAAVCLPLAASAGDINKAYLQKFYYDSVATESYPGAISGKVTIRPAFYSSIGRADVSGRTLLFEISYYCVDVIGDVHTAKSGEAQPVKIGVNDRFIYSIGRPTPVQASMIKPDALVGKSSETKESGQGSAVRGEAVR